MKSLGTEPNANMIILTPHEIQIWPMALTLDADALQAKYLLLNSEERARADRFHFAIHRERFIACRSYLREVLSAYIDCAPAEVMIEYDQFEKPYLASHPAIKFNLSHSEHLAVIAVTAQHPIGVDLEKQEDEFNEALAKRFFSKTEYDELMSHPLDQQAAAFYRLWARKEAVVKAIGEGLGVSLTSFSVSSHDISEIITTDTQEKWTVLPLNIDDGFPAAVVTNQPVTQITKWKLIDHAPVRLKD